MSQSVSRIVYMDSYDDYNTYLTAISGYTVTNNTGDEQYIYVTGTTSTQYVKLSTLGLYELYPNKTAHPTSADFSVDIYRTSGGLTSSTAYFNLLFDGTQVSSYSYSTKNTWVTKSSSNLTNSAILNSSQGDSEIKFGMSISNSSRTARYKNLSLTLYFQEYYFSATAGTGVESAICYNITSSSNGFKTTAGYDGDSIRYRCVVNSAYKFEGWYSGDTKVSSDEEYEHIVNGSDLYSLTAKAVKRPPFIKNNYKWNQSKTLLVKLPLVNITNLIPVGSSGFISGWETNSYVNYTGDGGLQMQKVNPETTSVMSTPITQTLGHTYYTRITQSNSSAIGSWDLYWAPINDNYRYAHGSFNGSANLSGYFTPQTAIESGYEHNLRIDFNYVSSDSDAPAIYRNFMLIDLTEAFGSGNEPTKEWCDKNISYFTGSTNIISNTNNITPTWVESTGAYIKLNNNWANIY